MKLELMDFQKKGVEFGKKHPYCIYAMRMGQGKSCTALFTAVELKARTLIIVPVYLALNWKREIEKFFPGKIVSVLKHSNDFYFPVDSDFVIITYSFVHKADILFEWAQMVIIDEGQLLKNMESKRSEAVHRLIYENSISRVIILTGTPILNRVYELYSLLAIMHYDPRVVDPPFLKKFNTYVAFANHFSYLNERQVNVGNRRVTVREWSGSKNEDELKEILSKFMYRPPNAVTLPKQYEKIVPVDDIDCPELQEAFETFISDDSNSRIQPRIKAQAALIKAPLTAEYCKSIIEDGHQVIVYSDHVESAKVIAEALGVKCITGEMPADKRFLLAEEFQAGDSDALVATIGSLSTGVNLQNGYNMVFNDFNWVPGNMDQAKYRILRIGQKKECTFHYIVGSRQDEYILEKLNSKIETIGRIYE